MSGGKLDCQSSSLTPSTPPPDTSSLQHQLHFLTGLNRLYHRRPHLRRIQEQPLPFWIVRRDDLLFRLVHKDVGGTLCCTLTIGGTDPPYETQKIN